jgi:hypothetical protein
MGFNSAFEGLISIVTTLWAGQSGNQTPARTSGSLFPRTFKRILKPTQTSIQWVTEAFPRGQINRIVRLNAHLRFVQRVRMSRTIPLLSLLDLMVCIWES